MFKKEKTRRKKIADVRGHGNVPRNIGIRMSSLVFYCRL